MRFGSLQRPLVTRHLDSGAATSKPIVPLGRGCPAEEVLLRMVGRDGEIIPPGEFLPTAEKYGLIAEIDRWVVSRTVERAAQGRTVECNLSAASLESAGMLSFIEQEIRRAALLLAAPTGLEPVPPP